MQRKEYQSENQEEPDNFDVYHSSIQSMQTALGQNESSIQEE